VGNVDAVVLPGGFAHGDYLRPGALARFSPIMEAVTRFAREGGPVVGICNGFQVLTEAGLLPGALQKNGHLRFLCQPTRLQVTSTASVLTGLAEVGQELVIPINHFSGSYTCDEETLQRLGDEDRIVLRYLDNPNGSVDDIAGITNEAGNVVGLMPHPERASHALLGSEDGLVLLRSLLAAATSRAAA
jgi:phosphoribosylformylglycinamidine synthase